MQVRLLGPIDVTVGGVARPVTGLRRKGILAVLGLAAGEIVSTDRLIDVVWGDQAPATAANALQSNISHLRGVLGSRTAIAARAHGYLLDLGTDATDVQVAERLVMAGRQSPDPARGAEHLRAALALWRGRPLADVADLDRLHGQAERLADLRTDAEQALVQARLALGEHVELVPELERLCRRHRFHEHLHAQLMLALYRAGRQADALAVCRRLREVLGAELGIDPGPHVRELEAAILRHDDALRPTPPVVVHEAPPAAVVPAQLPAAVDGFVGREAQLARLDAMLDAGTRGATVVVIGGTAGVGKSALAVHWAHRVRDRFPDGQLHLNLRGYAAGPPVEPAQALAQFLRALGVVAERIPPDVDEAAALYRTLLADRRMLIVLDNAAGPEQVRPLLPGGTGCLVLVTSRDRLGGLVAAEGARPLPLDVLDGREARALLTEIIGGTSTTGTGAPDPVAVAELALVCGYLPLALRIAAANLVVRPGADVAGYVAELRAGNRLAALRVDDDEDAAVRTAFDRSYDALKPDERRVFRLLGLVPGPDVDTAAVAALADLGVDRARTVLGRLVGRHLVVQPAPGRVTLHDLLRLYARSLADAEDGGPETAAAVGRLCAYYVDATDAAADLLYRETVRLPRSTEARTPAAPPFGDHTGALAWLDTERPNLAALVHETAEHGPRQAAWRLSDNLRGYFYLRRHGGDWLTVATDALRAADGLPQPQAVAHLSRGSAHSARGDSRSAIADFAAALALTERAGWSDGQAAALNNLGTVHSLTGRHREAARHFTQAAAVHEASGRIIGQAICLDNLGICRREMGELAEAARLHRAAIELHRRTGFPLGHATALTNLAAACHDLGLLEEALEHYSRAHALHRQTGNRDREALCLYGMADLHRTAGRLREAVGPAREALTLAREIADRRTEANATMSLAAIDLCTGQHRSALDRYRHALRLAELTDSGHVRATALVGVADAQRGLGHTDEALATVRDALELVRANGYRRLEADALATLAEILAGQGAPDEAATATTGTGTATDPAAVAAQALAIGAEIGYPAVRARLSAVMPPTSSPGAAGCR